jgi:hypothetical protein
LSINKRQIAEAAAVNLEFDADADTLVAEAASFFLRALPQSELGQGEDRAAWKTLVSNGWNDLGAELAAGNLDLGATVAIYREAGRHLLIEQYVTSGFVLSTLLSYAGDSAQVLRERLNRYPGVLLGDGRNWMFDFGPRIDGFCFGISEASLGLDAYRLVVIEGAIHLQRLDNGSIIVEPVSGLSPDVGYVATSGGKWTGVRLTVGNQEMAELRRREILVHSAALLGCAEHILAATCAYAATRVQFGVPIGSFQAIKHAIADVYAADEVAWAALLCACANDRNPDSATDVARLLVVDAALSAARVGAQVYGGIGFTWEENLHFALKAVLDGATRFGSSDEFASRIGMSLGAAPC